MTVGQASRYVSRGTIRHRLRSGRWQRPHPKVLVACRGPISEEQGRWIAALAVGAGRPALLAGLTALRAHGLRGVDSQQVFVLVPSSRRGGAPPPGVRVHRTCTLSPADGSRSRRPPRTSPARSVVDAAAWARSDREAALIIAATFQQRLVRLPDVLRGGDVTWTSTLPGGACTWRWTGRTMFVTDVRTALLAAGWQG